MNPEDNRNCMEEDTPSLGVQQRNQISHSPTYVVSFHFTQLIIIIIKANWFIIKFPLMCIVEVTNK